MKRFLITKLAERDLDQIKNFLVEKAGPTTTRRVLKDIRQAMELLAKSPGLGHSREDLTNRPLKFWPIYSIWWSTTQTRSPFKSCASCMECAMWKVF
jgi:toxin ParE1/3/4